MLKLKFNNTLLSNSIINNKFGYYTFINIYKINIV